VFISSFFSSWIYGGVFTYLEGRQRTEALVAIATGWYLPLSPHPLVLSSSHLRRYIFAGSVSRALARSIIDGGLSPLYMPLLVGAAACALSVVFLALADRAPAARPSAEDVRMRAERAPITPAQQWAFVRAYAPGLLCVLVPYAIITALRYYRDFYSQVGLAFTSEISIVYRGPMGDECMNVGPQ
jgi:hypothetical protein